MILAREPVEEKLTADELSCIRFSLARQKKKAEEALSRGIVERMDVDERPLGEAPRQRRATKPPLPEPERRPRRPPKPPDPPNNISISSVSGLSGGDPMREAKATTNTSSPSQVVTTEENLSESIETLSLDSRSSGVLEIGAGTREKQKIKI